MARGAIIGLAVVALAGAMLVLVLTFDDDSGGEAGIDVPFSTSEWRTDFANHSVPLDEFLSGGPPKDGIPAIDNPKFISTAEADGFLSPREPIAALELDGEARAYPIQILTWHEIVNDEIAGQPVSVTFCPLCNSTVAFSREVGGEVLDFGTTGKLRNSDLVMFDRQTESWWQQLTAEAIVGEKTGTKLDVLPSQILSWREFAKLHPGSKVLSRETGFDRPYGTNPYDGYDQPDSQPLALDGRADDRLSPKERVTAIQTGPESAVVYPFSRIAKEAPINDDVDGDPVVVLFDPDVASALDSGRLADGREVGSAAVFERRVAGRSLTFEAGDEPGEFRDRETESSWDMSGRASAGPLMGERLEPVVADDQFWFALAAFFPDAEIRG